MPNVTTNYAEGSCCQMPCPDKGEVAAASALQFLYKPGCPSSPISAKSPEVSDGRLGTLRTLGQTARTLWLLEHEPIPLKLEVLGQGDFLFCTRRPESLSIANRNVSCFTGVGSGDFALSSKTLEVRLEFLHLLMAEGI